MKKQILKQLNKTAELLPKSYELIRYGSYVRRHEFIKMLEKGMTKEISCYDDVTEGVKTLERWYGVNIPFECKETETGFIVDFLPIKGNQIVMNNHKEPTYHIKEPKFKEIIHVNRLKESYRNNGAAGVLSYIDWLDSNNKKMLEIKEKFDTLPEIVLVDRSLLEKI
jgi:hypothetical protein